MKTVRYKSGKRRGDSDRGSYAFFVLGALVVFAAVFFVGFQVGRFVEKDRAKGLEVRKGEGRKKESILREMSAYSEDAVRIPVVDPPPSPSANEELKKSEEAATFPDSLTRKDAVPQPLIKPKAPAQGSASAVQAKKKFLLQAGALKTREAADALKAKLDGAGFPAKVLHGSTNGEDVYRVRVGPHRSKEEATKVMKSIQAALKIDVILITE